MQIITVTLNPAIDKTVYLDKMNRGGCNRIKKSVIDAGGKGINVSKTLLALGEPSTAVAFAGGKSGRMLEEMTKELGLHTDFVWVAEDTRTNLKMVEEDGTVTEVNEPGPLIDSKEMEELLHRLEQYASKEALFVLSGSIPQGVPADIYGTIIKQVRKKGAKVILDSSGEALAYGIEAGPDWVKPNREELEHYFQKQDLTAEQIAEAGRRLLEKQIGAVVISMGKEGALFLDGLTSLWGRGLQIPVHSTVGAGDAMTAALAYGLVRGLSLKETAKWAVAASAGAVMTYGTKPASQEEVEKLRKRVQIEACFHREKTAKNCVL